MFDPISLGIAGIGLGMQIFGGMSQASASKHAAEISKATAREEQEINALKARQMELEARRTQIENIRNGQRARAMSEAAAVDQGAQFGTGLQGGLAQVQNQTFWNMLGVDNALEIGRGINKHNNTISGLKGQMAEVQSDAATAQGWSSLGGALIKAGPTIGQFAQSFGSSPSTIGTFNPNNWGAAPTWNTYA